MHLRLSRIFLFSMMLFAVPALSAQTKSDAPAAKQSTGGPWQRDATLGVKQLASEKVLAYSSDHGAHAGQSIALMVVGGAAIVIGALAGDDTGTILILGGAVVGLYGLYLYMR
jgi:poly-gamma-glutamate capsule biosynthesis protein CapA/YwtB (metallophosphatase superfamily)